MSEMKAVLGKTDGQKLENMRPADEEVKHDGKFIMYTHKFE